MPIMIGGGEFIINGAERVVVSQLHRSPGVDYVVETETGERKLHSCRIIPERGSWIELNVTKKDTLGVRIDQSGKFSSMTLLRAMDANYSRSADIFKAFYPTESIKVHANNREKLEGALVADDVVNPEDGELYAEFGERLTKEQVDRVLARPTETVLVGHPKDPLLRK